MFTVTNAYAIRVYLKRRFPLFVSLMTWPFKLKGQQKFIFSERSGVQKIRVSEQGGLRSLQFGEGDTPIQTCISLKKPHRLILGCSRLMMAALYLNPAPKKILILGLGGGVLSRALGELLPESEITNVEIDPLVAEIAERYFNFQASSQQQIIIDDGRHFIETAVSQGQQYDLIMLDAYNETYIPTRLMSIEFLHSVKSLLASGGVLAANTFSLSTLYDRESATYAAVFGEFYTVKFNNRILLAKKDGLPTLASIKDTSKIMASQFSYLGIHTPWLTNLFTTAQDWDLLALPLNDDFLT